MLLFLCMSSKSTEEGSTISCVIERTRGWLDDVYVNYTVTPLDSNTPAHQDFRNATGAVFFGAGLPSEVCVCGSLTAGESPSEFIQDDKHCSHPLYNQV